MPQLFLVKIMKVIDFIEELQKFNPSLEIIFCSIGDAEAAKLVPAIIGDLIQIHGVYFLPIGEGLKPMGEGKPEIVTIYIKQL